MNDDCACSPAQNSCQTWCRILLNVFSIPLFRGDCHGMSCASDDGSKCDSESKGIFDGLVTRGGKCYIDGSSSTTFVGASSESRERYSSKALGTIFPTVSAIGTMRPMRDSSSSTIVSTISLVWTRLCISDSDTVGSRPDQTTSPSSCSTKWNIAGLRPIFQLK